MTTANPPSAPGPAKDNPAPIPGDAPARSPAGTTLRRLMVVVLTCGGGWLSWEQSAPPSLEWLQVPLDSIQEAFDQANLEPRLGRALVGAGAGALLAFLFGGALLRRWRLLLLLVVLGAGVTAGWQLGAGPSAAWLERELGIVGPAPIMLISLAAAGLLLGLVELCFPAPPAPDYGNRPMNPIWLFVVLLAMVVAAVVLTEKTAPVGAEGFQAFLDGLQDVHGHLGLQPRWAQVLVSTGAAGMMLFLLGGELWRFGSFLGMIVILGLGAGAGWLLSSDWLAERMTGPTGIQGLKSYMALGLGSAGVLLGVVEFIIHFGATAQAAPAGCVISEAVVCVCEKCHIRYVLGVNASVVTFAEAMSQYKQLGSGRVLGGMPTDVPDGIMLKANHQSWPADKAVPKWTDSNCQEALREIRKAKQSGQRRKWQCNECKTIQSYRD